MGERQGCDNTFCWLPLLSAELQPLPVEGAGHTFLCHFLAAAAGFPACQHGDEGKAVKLFLRNVFTADTWFCCQLLITQTTTFIPAVLCVLSDHMHSI